jgi:cytochrome bd-type quinol oxidase subunit 2
VFASSFLLFGLLMTGAAAIFPVMLFSTISGINPLTAQDRAASDQSLWIAIYWWIPALVLAFIYLAIIQRHYSGKVSVPKDNQGFY